VVRDRLRVVAGRDRRARPSLARPGVSCAILLTRRAP
jgi:hypothetical protein